MEFASTLENVDAALDCIFVRWSIENELNNNVKTVGGSKSEEKHEIWEVGRTAFR